MADDYRYVVPRLTGTRWDTGKGRTSTDIDWPRVGIYCAHRHDPWLLGSFVLSSELLSQRDVRFWSWESKFMTGDGYLIQLGDRGEVIQEILRDEVRDREAEESAHLRAVAALEAGDMEAAQAALAVSSDGDAEMRLRFKVACGECKQPRTMRSDSIQEIVETFWSIGYREVPLRTFVARVDRAT